jgi:hypothetical protein
MAGSKANARVLNSTLVLRDADDPESVAPFGETLRTAFGPRQPVV